MSKKPYDLAVCFESLPYAYSYFHYTSGDVRKELLPNQRIEAEINLHDSQGSYGKRRLRAYQDGYRRVSELSIGVALKHSKDPAVRLY